MSDRTRVWASVIVGCVALVAMSGLLIARVPVTDILSTVFAISILLNVYLLNEVREVKKNTNGTIQTYQQQISDLIDYVKKSVPVKE